MFYHSFYEKLYILLYQIRGDIHQLVQLISV